MSALCLIPIVFSECERCDGDHNHKSESEENPFPAPILEGYHDILALTK